MTRKIKETALGLLIFLVVIVFIACIFYYQTFGLIVLTIALVGVIIELAYKVGHWMMED